MRFEFSFRHMDSSESLENYTIEKVGQSLERFLDQSFLCHTTFSVEGNRHCVHMGVHGEGHHRFESDASTDDMYASIEKVTSNLRKLLLKSKEKMKHHKGHEPLHEIAAHAEEDDDES